ncbi:hypothetical protein I6N95_17785 [Vagococcus sp. BWB3-3]|uniref:Uncharacterized protein n=1 Tax=Vagococcus allomyrinae TaxID=2794353 RepID=A0A940PB21_9ENTE|nr:hypothetical protein [Vagococcus allomyrinae]MBP1042871.1 hypothetical protein [Vagococcus allomyrinae]
MTFWVDESGKVLLILNNVEVLLSADLGSVREKGLCKMLTLNMGSALAIVIVTMLIGDVISNLTKGLVPQMLVVAVIFLVGFWTVFPADILEIAGIKTLSDIMVSFILIHVGTMFNVKDMIREWKVVVITLAAVVGIVAATLAVGTLLFGKTTAFTAAAPMTGGGMAALIIQGAANEAGRPDLGMLAMMIFVLQGFLAFPLTARVLGQESKRLLKDYRQQTVTQTETSEVVDESETKKRIYEYVPERFRSPTYYLAVLAIIGYLCGVLTTATGVNNAIIQILVGIVLSFFGIIEPKPLDKSASTGILNLALFASFMSSFALATWSLMVALLAQIAVLLVVGVIATFVATFFFGKPLGFSRPMTFAIGMNCFLGFPFNFALTTEAVKGATDDPAEADYLTAYLMPKMIIAGVVSISLVSAILAGVFAPIAFR